MCIDAQRMQTRKSSWILTLRSTLGLVNALKNHFLGFVNTPYEVCTVRRMHGPRTVRFGPDDV